jgi:hypothetical protein
MAALRDLAVIADWTAPALCGGGAAQAPVDAAADDDDREPGAGDPNMEEPGDDDEAGEAEEGEPAPLTISPANG